MVITCLDLIHQNAIIKGSNFDVERSNKADLILAEFDHLNLKKSDIYFVTNFHERRGGRLWSSDDEGFHKATKEFVDLAVELTKVANRFIKRRADANHVCTVS